jgi:hypothetical protein
MPAYDGGFLNVGRISWESEEQSGRVMLLMVIYQASQDLREVVRQEKERNGRLPPKLQSLKASALWFFCCGRFERYCELIGIPPLVPSEFRSVLGEYAPGYGTVSFDQGVEHYRSSMKRWRVTPKDW